MSGACSSFADHHIKRHKASIPYSLYDAHLISKSKKKSGVKGSTSDYHAFCANYSAN